MLILLVCRKESLYFISYYKIYSKLALSMLKMSSVGGCILQGIRSKNTKPKSDLMPLNGKTIIASH